MLPKGVFRHRECVSYYKGQYLAYPGLNIKQRRPKVGDRRNILGKWYPRVDLPELLCQPLLKIPNSGKISCRTQWILKK